MRATPTALWVVPVADLGGVARHVLDVARAGLPGWRLVVLCPEGPLAERLRELGTAVVTGEFGPDAGARVSLATLRRVVAALRPDVVHSHLAFADFIAAAALAGDQRTALVTTEHGIADDDLVYHGSEWRSQLKSELHAQRVKRADAIIAVAGATRDAMIRKWHPYRNIEVIPNGIDRPAALGAAEDAAGERTQQRDQAAAEPTVLSLSRLAPEKRIDQLLRAFALVRAQCPDARLVVAGTGPLDAELRMQADALGISEAVSFPGFVDADTAMASADVVAQLSVWENCSYTLLDAVSRGLGVVASEVGGNPELLGRHVPGHTPDAASFLVDADDTEAVAARILAQLDDPALRPALPAGWPTVADMCERTVAVYDRALGRRAVAVTPVAAAVAAPRDEIVIATNNGEVGGGEIMLFAIADAIRELGHPVRVIGMRDPGDLVASARERGHAVTELPASGRREYMLALRKWARRGEYRMLWCNGLVPAAATAGLPRRLVHFHKTADGAAQQALARAARVGALATIVPSEFMRGRFPGARVLPNWTDEIEVVARDARRDGPVRLGVLGRLSRIKGIDLLADAVGELVGEGHDLRLVVAGTPLFVEPDDLAPVEEALERLGDRVERRGHVEKQSFFADIDLLVVPSVVGESFGLVAAEAMAAGVPVIVSDAGALPEVVGPQHPWVFRAGALADAVRVLEAAIAALPDTATTAQAWLRWEQHFSLAAGLANVEGLLSKLGLVR